MSIWNDPDISYQQFGKYLCNESNRTKLQKIWSKHTKAKTILSELEPHEISAILVSMMKECIKSFNELSDPKSEQLQDASELFTNWIIENKLSGIPSSDKEDYSKMSLDYILNSNALFEWILESAKPLKHYIDSKNQHDPSLSQQQIMDNNKRMIEKHPSLAHLFQQKIVNTNENKFNNLHQTTKQTQEQQYIAKSKEATDNVHQLRQSRAMLYFNHSDIGYEVKTKCKIFKDSKLKEFFIEVDKGELMGGKKQNEQTKIIEIIEPIKGFIESKYIEVTMRIF